MSLQSTIEALAAAGADADRGQAHAAFKELKVALENGLIHPKPPGLLRLDTPAGVVEARYEQNGPFMERVRISHRVSNLYDAVTYLPPSTLKLPRSGQTYDYRHIRTLYSLEFQNGSLSSNHVIGSYFARLARLDPEFAKRTCRANPGFCPAPFASYGP